MATRTGIMLCIPFEEKRLRNWQPIIIAQPKLDGFRCRAVVENGVCKLFSSSAAEITSVPHINKAIIDFIWKKHKANIVLDGELYKHGMPFEEISSRVSRTVNSHDDCGMIEYHVFDVLAEMRQADRIEVVRSLIPIRDDCPIKRVVSHKIDNDMKRIGELLSDFMNQGYEGIILRNSIGFYATKRSNQIMKFKPRKEDEYEIVGVNQEISIHGRAKDSLGSLILRGSEGCTFCSGSGPALTREGRKKLWTDRAMIIGKKAVIKYQRLTEAGVPFPPILIEVK